jgi:ubiquinone biosynthesis protein UbiJ
MPQAFDSVFGSAFPAGVANALGTAAMERITLLLNHVIGAEQVATARLKPHSGRTVQLLWTGWPGLLPQPPVAAFSITPAGLLEWRGGAPADAPPLQPDLKLTLDASNPLKLMGQWLSGERPAVGIEGDSALAADVSWLIDNLRWDIEDDIARVIGQGPAHELSRGAEAVAAGLREAVKAVQGLVARGPRGPQ